MCPKERVRKEIQVSGKNTEEENSCLTFQVQLTDFENAAYVIFIALMTRVILSFKLNFLIPISKVRVKDRTIYLNCCSSVLCT